MLIVFIGPFNKNQTKLPAAIIIIAGKIKVRRKYFIYSFLKNSQQMPKLKANITMYIIATHIIL